ncbi:MAG: membrane protein insertion efficiency factor YidD [Hyphomonadaceae bacterium]|nr:membrane protein insertion efficiency factor YidD [Hyphomonadaceae bacterium]
MTDRPGLSFGPRLALGIYKITLSPLFAAFGARCRYAPTCSEYAAEAISRHGLWAGSWMALARLQRCHPLGGSGMDAVPETRGQGRWYMPWRYGAWVQPAGDTDADKPG